MLRKHTDAWNRTLRLQQNFTLGRLRFVYDRASPLNALTRRRRDAALDPGLKQLKGSMGMGLDQFQVWELFGFAALQVI
jgi:hypothetical protein